MNKLDTVEQDLEETANVMHRFATMYVDSTNSTRAELDNLYKHINTLTETINKQSKQIESLMLVTTHLSKRISSMDVRFGIPD